MATALAVILRLLFELPPRQCEGFRHSLFDLMGCVLDVPDQGHGAVAYGFL